MKKKVALVIMDGIGVSSNKIGNAVSMAHTPTLNMLHKEYPYTLLNAHGIAVGLPSNDDMGNSEVGHNALGSGQIYSQGAKLVENAIQSGEMFRSHTWLNLIENALNYNSTLHFIGLLSDGNIHSNISHLKKMLVQAKKDGVSNCRCHILLDGRDVPATSALIYVNELESLLYTLNDDTFDARIASGGGRMKITMDRYQSDWNMVKEGWDAHINGKGPIFNSAYEAITEYREKYNVIDQDLPSFVIGKDGNPVGKIQDNDSVVLFNFRGDRAIELTMAFEQKDFSYFDRTYFPKVYFAGMLQYDGDLNLPKHYLISPPNIQNTLTELLNKNSITSYAVSETQKFGHVTYFWNGNKSEKFNNNYEFWNEIKSDMPPFENRPWMKSADIAEDVIKAMETNKYGFIRCNFPNGDMVGHSGNFFAAVLAVESVDYALSRILKAADENDYTVIITSDHGNADQMIDVQPSGQHNIRTAHSLNKVPFIIYCKDKDVRIKQSEEFGLANVAPTIAEIIGIRPYDNWEESMLLK